MFPISIFFYYLSHVMIVLYNGLCVENLLQFGGQNCHVSSNTLSSAYGPHVPHDHGWPLIVSSSCCMGPMC